MTDTVHVGVIGAGYWGTKLIREYLSAEHRGGVKLAKICDSSRSTLLSCKEKVNVDDELLTSRVENIMEDSNISAVHIATPNHTHYSLARIALEAGKDVLVEKPMTLDSTEAYELVDLAASLGRVLNVGHIFRFNSALHKAREILQAKEIGKIFYARIQWADYCPPFPDRDIIFDLGPHPVDVLNQLLGAWPTQISGFARSYRNSTNHEEIAYAIAELDDGVFAHIELSWLHPGKVREASIVGSNGALVVDCIHQRVVRFDQNGPKEVPISVNNTIESEIDWFMECVRRRCNRIESGLIGARTVEVLEAMRKSIWERPLPIAQPVSIDKTTGMMAVLEMVSNGLDHKTLTREEKVRSRLNGYLEMVLRLGLIRAVASQEGTKYILTDIGMRFLDEYRNLERDQTEISPDRIASGR